MNRVFRIVRSPSQGERITLPHGLVYGGQVKAKRYASDHTIGRPEIQSFSGSLDGVGATKGIYVTSSSFTASAVDYVKKISKRIILIDGVALARLMIQHSIGVRMKATFEVKKLDEDYFNDE